MNVSTKSTRSSAIPYVFSEIFISFESLSKDLNDGITYEFIHTIVFSENTQKRKGGHFSLFGPIDVLTTDDHLRTKTMLQSKITELQL